MTPTYVDGLIGKFAAKAVLVDTNVLLLHFIGSFDVKLVERFKRTKDRRFRSEDFHLMEKFPGCFKKTVTIPNILTEVGNLAGQLAAPLKPFFLERLPKEIEILSEEYCPSIAAFAHPYFSKCGLTDAVILLIAERECLVVTDDFRLAGLISNRGLNVINFNHIRQSYLLTH
jgi:hypothetical protein